MNMLGWLAKKGENSRVYMCIKELNWELDAASQLRRAKILALSSLLREEIFGAEGIPLSVIDKPFDYPRNDLMHSYQIMENIRNSATLQFEHTTKQMRKLGVNMPEFAIEHVHLSKRSLEVFMCTVGAGICPERRDDVREIWAFLRSSKPVLQQAIVGLREIEQRTQIETGASTALFRNINTADWMVLCNFTPSIFTERLSF